MSAAEQVARLREQIERAKNVYYRLDAPERSRTPSTTGSSELHALEAEDPELQIPGSNAHPLYRMWKDRLDTELIREQERADRRAVRARELAAWHEAWRAYKARATGKYVPLTKPPWWNLVGWMLWILRLHAPGRPN